MDMSIELATAGKEEDVVLTDRKHPESTRLQQSSTVLRGCGPLSASATLR